MSKKKEKQPFFSNRVRPSFFLVPVLLIIFFTLGCAADDEAEMNSADQAHTDEDQDGSFSGEPGTRAGTGTGQNSLSNQETGEGATTDDMSPEEHSASHRESVATEETAPEDAQSVAEAENSEQNAETENGEAENEETDRKIIREQWLKQQVQDLNSVLDHVERSLRKIPGAYIESLQEWESEEQAHRTEHHAQVIMRIPHEEWETLEEEIEKQGAVQHRQVSGTDVTEGYIDNESRLRNLQAHEERILDLYDEADTIEDMLEIEGELSRIRGSIEDIEGRQQYLDNVTSTVKVTLELFEVEEYEYAGAENGESLWDEAQLGFQHSADSLLYFMQRAAVTLVSLSPYLLTLAVIGSTIFIGRKSYLRYKKKNG